MAGLLETAADAAAAARQLTWLADGDAYLTEPPTIVHLAPLRDSIRTLIDATRSALAARTLSWLGGKSGRDRTEAVFLKQLEPVTTDVSRRIVTGFVPGASLSIKTGHIRVPEFAVLTEAIVRELVVWLADAVAADGRVTRRHVEFCQAEIDGWCQTLWARPPQPDTAAKAMGDIAQMCRAVVWDGELWTEAGIDGLDPPEPDFESAPTLELGLARLSARATPQRLVADVGGVGWLGRDDVDPRLITAVSREPIRSELLKWADEAPLFDKLVERDYPDKLDPESRKKLGEAAVLQFCNRVRDADAATTRRQAFVDAVMHETAKGLLVGADASVETGQRVFSTWLQLVNPQADRSQFAGAVARMASLCEAHHILHTSHVVTRLEQDNRELKRGNEEIKRMLALAQEQADKEKVWREQESAKRDKEHRELVDKLSEAQQKNARIDEIYTYVHAQNATARPASPQHIGGRIECDPTRPDWRMTSKELDAIFDNHPDQSFKNIRKRAQHLRRAGAEPKRTKKGNGWQCVRPLN